MKGNRLTILAAILIATLATPATLLAQRANRPGRGSFRQALARPNPPTPAQPADPSSWFPASIQSVDPFKDTITLSVLARTSRLEDTFDFPKTARILIDTAAGQQQGSLDQLLPGASAYVQLAADGMSVVSIRVTSGPSIQGFIRSADPANHTVTITPSPKRLVFEMDKTFQVTSDTRIQLNQRRSFLRTSQTTGLADLVEGMPTTVRLAPDGTTVLSLMVRSVNITGTVKELDLPANVVTITVDSGNMGGEKALTLSPNLRITLSEGRTQRPGQPADLAPGAAVTMQLSADDSTLTAVTISRPAPSK